MRARSIVSLLCVLIVSLCAQAGTISFVQITGDADCGISTENTYTHTLDFGTGSPGATVNGVQFDAYNAGANGTLNFNRTAASGTLNDHAGNAGHNVTGGLADLLTDMYFNGDNAVGGTTTWTLSGLTPGQAYSVRIYTRQWGAGGTRVVSFVFDPDGAGPISDSTDKINEDDATTVGMPSANTAYYINYEFVAVTGEDLAITLTQDFLNYSWHLYGLTCQEISLGAAYLPSPAKDATDVPRDTSLSWTAGDGAVSHNVYFGTSYDAVLAGDASVLVSEGQTSTTFELPEILDFSTTYYWRVDEVQSDSSVMEGMVWSFESEPFAYAIEGIIATSNMVPRENQGPEKTIDGSGLDENDQHSVEPTDMWSATMPEGEAGYIQYEFDRIYKIHEMLVWNSNTAFEMFLGLGVKDVTIECSIDGTDWTLLTETQFAQAPGTTGYAAGTVVPFEGAAAKFVRLTVNSTYIDSGIYGLSEVRFMQIPAYARDPQPADGAMGVPIDAILDWRGGRDAAEHEVYLSTDSEAVDLVDTVAQSSYDPGGLTLASTYYWTINEVNDAEATPVWDTDLWSFSTQEYIEIDGFETYNDDVEAEETIWHTWNDGLVDSGVYGGSQVGYDQAPFAEQTIRRTGDQSMPLQYNNSDYAYSEVERTFSPAQDWSVGEVKSLSLYFFGAADNVTGQLYAKINGTKVLYEGSAEDLKLAVWMPWTIDLTTAGVNLQSVSTLSIGVEGGGGTGLLFVDDIRLYSYASEQIDTVEPNTDGLVAYWPLDGDATDVVGGNNGTIAEGMEFTDGYLGQATDGFDLEDIAVPYSDDFALNTFTVAAWINVSDIDGSRGILGTRFNGDNTFDLKVDAARVHGDIGDGTVWINTAVDIDTARGGALPINTWQHIAYVIDAETGTAELYLNGALARTITFTGTPLLMKADQELHISNSSGVEYMRGSIDEVRIYNVALTEGEVAGLVGRPGPIYEGF